MSSDISLSLRGNNILLHTYRYRYICAQNYKEILPFFGKLFIRFPYFLLGGLRVHPENFVRVT